MGVLPQSPGFQVESPQPPRGGSQPQGLPVHGEHQHPAGALARNAVRGIRPSGSMCRQSTRPANRAPPTTCPSGPVASGAGDAADVQVAESGGQRGARAIFPVEKIELADVGRADVEPKPAAPVEGGAKLVAVEATAGDRAEKADCPACPVPARGRRSAWNEWR